MEFEEEFFLESEDTENNINPEKLSYLQDKNILNLDEYTKVLEQVSRLNSVREFISQTNSAELKTLFFASNDYFSRAIFIVSKIESDLDITKNLKYKVDFNLYLERSKLLFKILSKFLPS